MSDDDKRVQIMLELHARPLIMACRYPAGECSCAAADYVDRLISRGLLGSPP